MALKGKDHNQYKHGLSNTKLEGVYRSMLNRCYLPTSTSYKHYGARGITVCEEWLNKQTGLQNFHSWASNNGYSPDSGLSIDRIDVNGPYSPENCQWVSHKIQMNNTRANHKIEIFGEVMNLKEAWRRFSVVDYRQVHYRLKQGWEAHAAVLMPKVDHIYHLRGQFSMKEKPYCIFGKRMTFSEVFEKFSVPLGLKKKGVQGRLSRGWSPTYAFLLPPISKKLTNGHLKGFDFSIEPQLQ